MAGLKRSVEVSHRDSRKKRKVKGEPGGQSTHCTKKEGNTLSINKNGASHLDQESEQKGSTESPTQTG